jgi:hypothetical protein
MLEAEAVLDHREAELRAAAVTCLTGFALVQAIGLAPLLAESRLLGVVSLTGMTLCIALAWTLAAAPAVASPGLWQLVAVAAALVLTGWTASRVLGIPGLADSRGRWIAMPGAATAALAGVALALSLVAAPPTLASLRRLATGVAVVAALGPGVGVLLVAAAPGPPGGETALAAPGHTHVRGAVAPKLRHVAGPGRDAGYFVIATTPRPRPTAVNLVLLAATALVFLAGALGGLRRRSAPGHPAPASGLP